MKTSITEGLSDTKVASDVEKVWDKKFNVPLNRSYLDSPDEFLEAQDIETTFKINKNQVFEVSVKHVKTNNVLLTEEISMLDGSLSTNSSIVDEDLDDFELK